MSIADAAEKLAASQSHPVGDTTSHDGQQRIKRYIAARRDLERAREKLKAAEGEMALAETDVGRFLLPDDAKLGEQFGIWYMGALIIATKVVGDRADGTTAYAVAVRQRERNVEPGL